jgi:hypothetical protein
MCFVPGRLDMSDRTRSFSSDLSDFFLFPLLPVSSAYHHLPTKCRRLPSFFLVIMRCSAARMDFRVILTRLPPEVTVFCPSRVPTRRLSWASVDFKRLVPRMIHPQLPKRSLYSNPNRCVFFFIRSAAYIANIGFKVHVVYASANGAIQEKPQSRSGGRPHEVAIRDRPMARSLF